MSDPSPPYCAGAETPTEGPSSAQNRVRKYVTHHGSVPQDYLDDPMGAPVAFCWKHPVYADDLNDLLCVRERNEQADDDG